MQADVTAAFVDDAAARMKVAQGEQAAASAIVKTDRGYSQQPLRASSEARGGQRKTTVLDCESL